MPHTKEKEDVALHSIYASAGMTIAKFIVGILTGSLGLLSEALHSLLDLGATIMTYIAVRISGKPADDKHHYGHGKIESVSALAETGLLFLTSVWIVYEAVHRLISGNTDVEVTWWSIAVIVGSIIIDFFRARALTRVAEKTKSQALEADALHFSSDILSSSVVLLGLIFVAIGWPQGDSVAAIGVAVFVCRAGWKLGKKTIDTLTDAAPEGIGDRVRSITTRIPSIIRTERVRARPAGSVLFIEMDISVTRGLSLTSVNEIKDQLKNMIEAEIPEAELSITTTAVTLNDESIHQRINIIASHMRLPIHHITIHHVGEKISISLDMEVNGSTPLGEAHDLATELENGIIRELGENVEVETHIEPLQTEELEGKDLEPEKLEEIEKTIRTLVETGYPSFGDVHHIRIRKTPSGLIIIFHCRTNPMASVGIVHETLDSLERTLREKYPETLRVIGHAEPYKNPI